MLISVALQNHDDKKDGIGKNKSTEEKKVSRNGIILRQVLKMSDLDEIVKTLVDERFEGNTMVSDGKRLFIIEIFLHQQTKDKIIKDYEIDPIQNKSDIKKEILKHINPEDYMVSVKEIKNDSLVVRTNHGIFLSNAGYTKKDGDGYKSSISRRNITIDYLKNINIDNPFDVLVCLNKLNSKNLKLNTELCPIREFPSKYITTSILMLSPSGVIYVIPKNCKFSNTSLLRVTKDRDTQIVILPKNLPLYENNLINKINTLLI
jgi:hypothetical protein